jgi:hypothetical protein
LPRLDPQVVQELDLASEVTKHQTPIEVDQYGRIISGNHRFATRNGPRWPRVTVKVKDDEDYQLRKMAAKVQRIVSEQERKEDLIELAKILEKKGIPTHEIAQAIIERVKWLSPRRILELLPTKYKHADKAEAGRLGAEEKKRRGVVSAATAAAEPEAAAKSDAGKTEVPLTPEQKVEALRKEVTDALERLEREEELHPEIIDWSKATFKSPEEYLAKVLWFRDMNPHDRDGSSLYEKLLTNPVFDEVPHKEQVKRLIESGSKMEDLKRYLDSVVKISDEGKAKPSAVGVTQLDYILQKFAEAVDEWRDKGLADARKKLQRAIDETLEAMLDQVILDPMREELRKREEELISKYGFEKLRGLSTYQTAEIWALSKPHERDKQYWEKLKGALQVYRDFYITYSSFHHRDFSEPFPRKRDEIAQKIAATLKWVECKGYP